MTIPVRRAGSAPALRLVEKLDFTGGLNKTEDRFNLADNETPDVLNVDVQRRGGFQLRGGVQPFGADPATAGSWEAAAIVPTRIFVRQDAAAGSPQVLVHGPAGGWWGTGGAWTAFAGSTTFTDHAQLNGISFLCSSVSATQTWDGSTLTSMTLSTSAWQNDYSAPSGAHAPLGAVAAAHSGYMWLGDTTESGTRHESRIRFSHPGDPGSWAEDDYIEIGLGDGDAIQRIVSFRDHLLVIKNTSVWAVYGYDRQTFQVVEIDGSVGATSYNAVATSPDAVWFFSADRGLYAWDGQQIVWAFAKLYPLYTDGTFDATKLDEIHVMWVRDRVWVRIEDITGDVHTFPLDPALGAWTCYNLDIKSAATYLDSNGTPTVVAATGHATWMVALEQATVVDDFGEGDVDIESFYTTPWMDDGRPFQPKRWKRPEFVVRGNTAHAIQVDLFKDFNDQGVVKSFLLETVGIVSTTDLVWDSVTVGDWDDFSWAAQASTADEIIRGSAVSGSGRALMMRFHGPTSTEWEVRAFTLKYRPKKVKS